MKGIIAHHNRVIPRVASMNRAADLGHSDSLRRTRCPTSTTPSIKEVKCLSRIL